MTPDHNTPYEGPFEKALSALFKLVLFLIVIGLLTLLIGLGAVLGFFFANLL